MVNIADPLGEGKSVALRAVVVGGGIGGIAAAVALARAGIDVQVHEQAQQLTEVGAGVSLAPNGLRMLERLGVGEGIRRAGVRYASAQLRLPDGRVVRHEPYQFAVAGTERRDSPGRPACAAGRAAAARHGADRAPVHGFQPG